MCAGVSACGRASERLGVGVSGRECVAARESVCVGERERGCVCCARERERVGVSVREVVCAARESVGG